MKHSSELDHDIDVYANGHAGSYTSPNQNGVPEAFLRHKLTEAECRKRGVRFLPAQVMRPILRDAGL